MNNNRTMADENYPQAPTSQTPSVVKQQPAADVTSGGVNRSKFPYPDDAIRIQQYEYFERLFAGNHFSAFNIKIESKLYGDNYSRLRYVVANFPGLISRVIADLLFIEPPKVVDPDGNKDRQKWIDALLSENKMRTTNYESALANSYLGDNLYKLRIGKRNPKDTKATIIIEEVTPKIYFPLIDPYNEKGAPVNQELAWKVKIGETEYLRKEIHTPGKIENKVYKLKGDILEEEVDISILGIPTLKPVEVTKIDRSVVVHVPNIRNSGHFGVSDYADLTTLFYAMNNRLTMIDNILDKHSDPILALPQGILDEQGRIKKEKLGLIERPEGSTKEEDPNYITWDANLESAFKEIDKLIDVTLMMSDTAPDVFGMGKGQSDSGRALKFKLLRTIAKAQRKQLYYTEGLKEVIYVAQLLAKKWDVEVGGLTLKGDPAKPEIVWADGLPADAVEAIENEAKRIDAGLTTKTSSIMRLDDVDKETAEKEVKEIREEGKLDMPQMTITPDDFDQKPGDPKKADSNNKPPQEAK